MSQLSNVVLPTPCPDLIDTRSCRPTASRASACQGSGLAPRTSVTNKRGWFLLRIQAVCQFVSETIAYSPPQLDEGLVSFDVDVRLLWQKTGYNTDIDVRLTFPHQHDGLRSKPLEVGFQSLKKLSAQAIARAFRTPFRIATLSRLEGPKISQFFLCIIRDLLLFYPPH